MQDLTLDELGSDALERHMELLGEIEAGSHFDHADPEHRSWLRERLNRHIGHGVRFFEAKTPEGDVLGIFALRTDRGLLCGTTAELTHVGTVRGQRGLGIGTRLLEMAKDLARREGAHTLFVHTYAGSTRTVAFYGLSKFQPVAVIPDTNGPDDDGTIVMRCRLGE